MTKKLVTSNNTSIFVDNNIDINERIIHLFGPIDQDSASNTIKGLQLMLSRNNDPIDIYINSFGGCPYSSFGIYDFIRENSNATIRTHIQGCAMSGGSIVFMAGDERYMSKNSVLMIHSVSSIAEGKVFLELEAETEECKLIHKQLCEIYAENSNKSFKQWNNLLRYKDKYYRVNEALELNFIHTEE